MLVNPQIQTRRTRSSGFTLVEVAIAVGIGSIVFVSLYAGLARCFNSVQSARHRLRATQTLTEKMELVRLYNWTQINTPGFMPATFTEYYHPLTNGAQGNAEITYSGTITLTAAPVQPAYTNTMRKAVIQVTWVSGGITNQQRMETLISQYGVQNYIY